MVTKSAAETAELIEAARVAVLHLDAELGRMQHALAALAAMLGVPLRGKGGDRCEVRTSGEASVTR